MKKLILMVLLFAFIAVICYAGAPSRYGWLRGESSYGFSAEECMNDNSPGC